MEQLIVYDITTREVYALIPTVFYGEKENAVLKTNLDFEVVNDEVMLVQENGLIYYYKEETK